MKIFFLKKKKRRRKKEERKKQNKTNLTVQIFIWREKHVLQRYTVSQISYGRSINNMEQTIKCFTEVVFNVAVWYLSSRKIMGRYLLPD